MVKETIHYSCGHIGIKNIIGNTDYRKNQVKYYERGICPDCYKSEQNKKAIAISTNYGLPKLTGSEKQINWAESIRSEQYTKIKNNLIQYYTKLSNSIKDKPKYQFEFNDKIIHKSITKHLSSFINSKTSARYWIDNRGSITHALNELYPKINNDVQTFINYIKSESIDKPKSIPNSKSRKSKLSTTKKLINEGKIKQGFVRRLGIKRQTKSGSQTKSDKKRMAMLPGYRVSKSGKLYCETRQNRSDTPKQRKEVNAYLERKKRKTQKRIPVSKHIDKYKPKK